MKFKIKKDLFLKKSTWVVLGLFAVTLVNIPRFKTQATGTIDSLNFEPDTLKILEIVPGNEYTLANGSDTSTEVKGQKLEVTHMNMAKFISMVDDIRGEYDVVAITNKVNNNKSDKNYMPDKYWTDKTYRQYTSPLTQSMGKAAYENGTNYDEKFPENDITNKRGKLIVDMINKGQLVYVDSSITSISGTKLSTIFNGQGNSSDGTVINNLNATNFKKVSADNITLEKIVDDYKGLNQDSKRVKVSAGSGPNGDKTDDRTLNFSFKANAEADENLTFNVYLDFDGDGLFTGNPYESFTKTGSKSYQDYDFSVDINKGFIGYLGWKVEVVRPNGVKTDIQSHATYHAVNGKQQIKVLQIYPDSDTCAFYDNIKGQAGSGITRLSKSEAFMNLLKDDKVAQDYDIKLTDISASEFNNKYGTASTKSHLTNDYDMVIVGFADNYGNVDISNADALADLDNFIAAGKSVMFTHDTVGLGILGKEKSGPTKFAQHYKDVIGQSRYKDVFRTSEENLYTTKNDDGTAEKKTIPHDKSNGNTLGQTALANDWISTQSHTVKNVNDAQITTYPFDLRSYNGGNSTINVSLTHTQWYQLNLEDEDLVPWYNLTNCKGGTVDDGDSRNFYYTYSKGNITYSGTAHSGVATDVQELELFVNTIIKSVRGGNAAPTVKNYSNSDISDSNLVADGSTVQGKINTDNDYTFYSVPSDNDGDKVTVKATVNGTVLDNSAIEIAETGEKYDGGRINSDTLLKITIPASVYKTVAKGTEIPVEVTAFDPLKKEGKSSFKLLSDGNQAPDITNMKGDTSIDNNQEVNAPRTADFTFTTIPTDPDEEDKDNLSVSIKVDGQEILKKDKVTSDSKIDVTIPEDLLAGKQTGDKVTVETTVNDNHTASNEATGKSATKKFVLVIDAENPCVNLSVVESVDESGVFKEVPNDKTFVNLDTVKLAGKITSVYDNSGVIGLEVPKYENVEGDVTVRRLVNGKLSDTVWKMTKDNSNIGPNLNEYYSLDLGAVNPVSLGAVDKGGMQFIVEYSIKIDDTENLQKAKDNPTIKEISYPDEVTVVDDDEKTVTTTVTKKTTIESWSYSNIYMNTLSFGDKKAIANVKLDMSDSKSKDTSSSDEDIIKKPIPKKNYGYPNLF